MEPVSSAISPFISDGFTQQGSRNLSGPVQVFTDKADAPAVGKVSIISKTGMFISAKSDMSSVICLFRSPRSANAVYGEFLKMFQNSNQLLRLVIGAVIIIYEARKAGIPR